MGSIATWLGVVLIAVATLTGAGLGGASLRGAGRLGAGRDGVTGTVQRNGAGVAGAGPGSRDAEWRGFCLGAAAGALLVIAGVHLLPDAWSDARAAGLPEPLVPLAAAAAFALTTWLTRRGCTCAADREEGGGIGTTVALAGHRVLEGAALAVTGSVTVLAALVTHAVAEGLAAGTLLAPATRRRRTGWLAALCLSPALGVAIAGAGLPARLAPLLVASAVGVLAQAARISLAAAFASRRVSRVAPTAAMLAAGLVTTLAVLRLG